jgi:hypothetical protein
METDITKAFDVRQFSALKNLKSLYIDRDSFKASDSDIDFLHNKLPDCEITLSE